MSTAQLAPTQTPTSTDVNAREGPEGHTHTSVEFDSLLANEFSQYVNELASAPFKATLHSRSRRGHFRDVLAAIERRQLIAHSGERSRAEMQWLREHRAEYGGRWVALIGNHLLSVQHSAREAYAAVRNAPEVPLVVWVEPADEMPFAGW